MPKLKFICFILILHHKKFHASHSSTVHMPYSSFRPFQLLLLLSTTKDHRNNKTSASRMEIYDIFIHTLTTSRSLTRSRIHRKKTSKLASHTQLKWKKILTRHSSSSEEVLFVPRHWQ